MTNSIPNEFQVLTQELYKKNLELVRTNKELIILQRAYEIMTETNSVKDMCQALMELLTTKTTLTAGNIILAIQNENEYKIIGVTHTKFDSELERYARVPSDKISFFTKDGTFGSQIKAIQQKKPLYNIPLADALYPILDKELTTHLSEKTGVKFAATFPLKSSRTKGSSFTVFYTDESQLGTLERRSLVQISTVLGLAIDRSILLQDLKRANHHLKRLDKLKDEFVFIATHELKNPVTAMRGYLTMFSEGVFGNIPEKMKDPINQLQGANQQLVDLVNDLLQIARSESKTMTIRTEPVDLGPIVAMIMEGTKPLADQKKLIVTYKSFPTLPQVQGDAGRIKEIVGNLISNAIKYSDRGTITISHEIKADKIITNVADQGVGISEADQSHLFTRFYRVEQEAARGIPGTGLGLFIVKQLVEKMGGTITLTSKKGEGTTFSFSLPRTQ